MKKITLLIFGITIIISIFVFIKYKGYVGMFDFLKKEQIDTTKIELVEQPLPIEVPTMDTVYIYRIIVGSFKSYENAVECLKQYPFSDMLEVTEDGYYRVSKSTHFNKEDAQIERDTLGEDVWVLEDFIILDI